MAHVCFHSRKWVHYSAFGERSHTRAHAAKQGPPLPRPQCGFVLPVKSLQSLHLQPVIPPCLYIHTFPGSLWPPIISNSSTSDHLSSCFSTSPTNGPRSLSQVKVGTHSPSPTGSHTAAYTPKQGPSGRGRYHYPRSVPHVHKHPRAGYQNGVLCRFWVLAGCTPKNAESLGTAMRLCASLLRRRRGPAGLRSLLPVCIQLVLVGWKDLTKRSDRVTITRNDRTASRLALVRKPRWAVK